MKIISAAKNTIVIETKRSDGTREKFTLRNRDDGAFAVSRIGGLGMKIKPRTETTLIIEPSD